MAAPTDNQISISFTPAELSAVDAALTTLENFAQKLQSLSPEQSQMYGKLGTDTEGFINQIHEDAINNAGLAPAFVDATEWKADVTARAALLPRATRLEAIAQRFTDTARILGFDMYTSSLAVYNNVKFLAGQNQGSAKTFYEKWKPFFKGGRKAAPKTFPGS